jgi:hypothetical protein
MLKWKYTSTDSQPRLQMDVNRMLYFRRRFPGAHIVLLDGQIERNEMDGACSASGGEKKRIQGFGGET